jgi:hypothetical protein
MSTTRTGALAVVLALLVVFAGCTARQVVEPSPTPTTEGPIDGPGTATGTPGDGGARPDPSGDPLGFEDGYWYDDPVAVDPEDGYDRSEIDRVVARTMARIERIRGLEFTDEVSVEVISRAEYRERSVFEFDPDPARDQLWEALFVVGEDREAATVFNEVYGGSVSGYYAGGEIVLVSDDPDSVGLSRATLAHELVHALQDQRPDLTVGGGGPTRDARLASLAVSEGEANYLMDEYLRRCGGEWSCIPAATGGGGADRNQGVFLSAFVPYSDGPTLIGALFERGGWAAVTEAYGSRPVSTEQVIHPEKYPDERPVEVRVPDRARNGWERLGGGDVVGEATVFAGFVHAGVIPPDHLLTDAARYNYSHPITAGWGGDRFVPYRNGDRFGYVFETAWDTDRDARQFLEGYRSLLDAKNATEVREGVYRIPDSNPYGDAFRVVRDGKRVRIVNAPTVAALDDVSRPG